MIFISQRKLLTILFTEINIIVIYNLHSLIKGLCRFFLEQTKYNSETFAPAIKRVMRF